MLVSSLLAVLLGQTVGKIVLITDGDTITVKPEQGASEYRTSGRMNYR